jgi:shikimate kinase
MGTGKTTIGRSLAQRLGMPFFDTDREIEKAFGLSVPEIFAERGEPEFRATERELVSRLLPGPAKILSLGGGAYVDFQTREAVNRVATTVWLDPPFELILARLARSNMRPIASEKSPEELRRLWNERRASYANAHLRIVTSDGEPREAVEQILKALT